MNDVLKLAQDYVSLKRTLIDGAETLSLAREVIRLSAVPETDAQNLREAMVFFMATAFADGYFDDEGDEAMKERVRAWILKQENSIRDGITIQQVVEAIVGGGGPDSPSKEG